MVAHGGPYRLEGGAFIILAGRAAARPGGTGDAAVPVEEHLLERRAGGIEKGEQFRGQCVIRGLTGGKQAKAVQHGRGELALKRGLETAQRGLQLGLPGDWQQALGQAGQVPQQRCRLPAIGIEAGMVEIGRSEAGIVGGQKRQGP